MQTTPRDPLTEELSVVPSNAFPQLLQNLEGGEKQHEVSRKLTELVRAVSLLGKPGKMNIVLTATPVGKGSAISFSLECENKLPKAKADETLMFVDANRGFVLTKDNPSQMPLKFSEVKRSAPEGVKEASRPSEVSEVRAATG